MRWTFVFRALMCCFMLAGVSGYAAAQEASLAEVARQQRQHQGTKAKRVMSNDDLPHAPAGSTAVTADKRPSTPETAVDTATGSKMLRQNLENERYLTERIATLEQSLVQASAQDVERIKAAIENYRKALSENKQQRKFLEDHVAKQATARAEAPKAEVAVGAGTKDAEQ